MTSVILEVATGSLLALAVQQIWQAASEPEWEPGRPVPRPRSSALIDAAEKALRSDPDLTLASLRMIPGARGSIELLGWVDSRSERTRAARVVAAALDPIRLVNGVLVRGEDDDDFSEIPDEPTQGGA